MPSQGMSFVRPAGSSRPSPISTRLAVCVPQPTAAPETVATVLMVSVAALLVAEPNVFVNTARYWVLLFPEATVE